MFCQYCGSKIPANADSCPQCRRPVPSASTATGAAPEGAGQPAASPLSSRPAEAPETIAIGGCVKAPGFMFVNRIPGTLTLTADSMYFKKYGILKLNTILTLGLQTYSQGDGLEWPLSDIQRATLEKGFRNATLKIRGESGKEADFEIAKSSKLDKFYNELLARMASSRP